MLAALFSATTDAVYVKDPQGRYLFVNRAAEAITGKSASEALGKDDTAVFAPAEATVVMEGDRRAMAAPAPVTYEETVTDAAGVVRTYLSTKGPVRDKAGTLLGLFGIARDVTERKRAEMELAGSQARLRRFFNAPFVGTLIVGPDGMLKEANDYFLAMIGRTRDEFERGAIDWRSITPPEHMSVTDRAIAEMQASGSSGSYEKEYLRPDGSRVQALVVAGTMPGTTDQGAVFVLDITERKRAEARLAEQTALLRSVIESSEAAVFAVDREYRYAAFNAQHAEAMRALYGVEIELGRSLLDYQRAAGDDVGAKRNLDRALAGERCTDEGFSGEEGRTRAYFEVTHAPVRDLAGVIVGASVFARDTTARHRTDDEIRDTQALLNQTQELAKIGAWKYEAATDTVTWTDEVYRIHELSRDEYEPNSAAGDIAFYAPGDQARIDEAFRLAVSDGRSYDLELHLNTARGHEIWVRTSGHPEIEDGRVVRIYGDIQDITERKRAEEELRATNVRLRRFVDANLLGVFEARLEGTVVEANDYFLDLVGHTRAELERGEIDWLAMTAPESRPSSDAAVREMRARGSASYEKEYLRPDGTRVPVLVADALFPGSDNVIGGFVLDITERTRAEQTIGELAQLVELAHDAIIVRTVDSRVRFWSRGAEALYGWSAAEAVGRMTHELLQTVFPVSVESTDDDLESNGRWQGELRHTTRDGRLVVVESRQSVERDPAGRVTKIIEINRDITERKAAEEGIRELNAGLEARVARRTVALEAANRELEAFSYSVSHDLRAPLRSIDAFSQILLNEHAAPLDAEGRRILAIVLRNVKQMETLIDDLLAFSRVSRAGLERRPVDMARLAQSVADEIRTAEPDRVISFDVGALADVPGDAGLLRQVWANLLGNAVKFTRPVEHATVEVRSERADGEFRFTVRDNGVGFDPAYLDKLFAPFSRLHPTAEFEGTGIGLAIVARIVTRHGGRVWADGTPGGGATFGFALPTGKEAA